jgi:hypothetical protein
MEKMRVELQNEVSPLDADLEKVISGLHQWHTVNKSAVEAVDRKVDVRCSAIEELLREGFSQIDSRIAQGNNAADDRLASALIQVAMTLKQSGEASHKQGHSKQTRTSQRSPKKARPADCVTTKTAGTTRDDDSNSNCDDVPVICNDPVDSTVVGALLTGIKESASRMLPTQVSPVSTPPQPWLAIEHKGYCLKPKHACLRQLYDEWHGLDSFQDVFGGIAGREELYGKKWRKHLDQQQFSLIRRLVKGIAAHCVTHNMSPADACEALNDLFVSNKCSVGKTVSAFQTEGVISKGKTRRRKKVEVEVVE